MRPVRLPRDRVRIVVAASLGAGVAASGFPPLALLADVLRVEARPWAVLLLSPVLLAAFAVTAAVAFPLRGTDRDRTILAGALLLIAGSALSLSASSDTTGSLVLLVQGVLAPLV